MKKIDVENLNSGKNSFEQEKALQPINSGLLNIPTEPNQRVKYILTNMNYLKKYIASLIYQKDTGNGVHFKEIFDGKLYNQEFEDNFKKLILKIIFEKTTKQCVSLNGSGNIYYFEHNNKGYYYIEEFENYSGKLFVKENFEIISKKYNFNISFDKKDIKSKIQTLFSQIILGGKLSENDVLEIRFTYSFEKKILIELYENNSWNSLINRIFDKDEFTLEKKEIVDLMICMLYDILGNNDYYFKLEEEQQNDGYSDTIILGKNDDENEKGNEIVKKIVENYFEEISNSFINCINENEGKSNLKNMYKNLYYTLNNILNNEANITEKIGNSNILLKKFFSQVSTINLIIKEYTNQISNSTKQLICLTDGIELDCYGINGKDYYFLKNNNTNQYLIFNKKEFWKYCRQNKIKIIKNHNKIFNKIIEQISNIDIDEEDTIINEFVGGLIKLNELGLINKKLTKINTIEEIKDILEYFSGIELKGNNTIIINELLKSIYFNLKNKITNDSEKTKRLIPIPTQIEKNHLLSFIAKHIKIINYYAKKTIDKNKIIGKEKTLLQKEMFEGKIQNDTLNHINKLIPVLRIYMNNYKTLLNLLSNEKIFCIKIGKENYYIVEEENNILSDDEEDIMDIKTLNSSLEKLEKTLEKLEKTETQIEFYWPKSEEISIEGTEKFKKSLLKIMKENAIREEINFTSSELEDEYSIKIMTSKEFKKYNTSKKRKNDDYTISLHQLIQSVIVSLISQSQNIRKTDKYAKEQIILAFNKTYKYLLHRYINNGLELIFPKPEILEELTLNIGIKNNIDLIPINEIIKRITMIINTQEISEIFKILFIQEIINRLTESNNFN